MPKTVRAHRDALSRAVALALTLIPASARALELGVEAGPLGTVASHVPNVETGWGTRGNGIGGILVEHSLRFDWFRLDLWADAQFPMPIEIAADSVNQYLPVDLGVRTGLALGRFEHYVGILGQAAFSTGPGPSAYDPPINPAIYGLGGDLGLDVTIWFLRVGADFRFVGILSPIQQGAFSEDQVMEFSALLSVRFVIFQ